MREVILSGRAQPFEFYPISLTQLITIGFPHNWSAYRATKTIPNVGPDDSSREVDIFRFYFDGLIAHMHVNDDPEMVTKQAGFFVGQASETLVTTLRAQDSLQMEEILGSHSEHRPIKLKYAVHAGRAKPICRLSNGALGHARSCRPGKPQIAPPRG